MCYICKDKLNKFCYICQKYIFLSRAKRGTKTITVDPSRPFTSEIKLAYLAFFGCPIQHEEYAPTRVCMCCYNKLIAWFSGSSDTFPFCSPTISVYYNW